MTAAPRKRYDAIAMSLHWVIAGLLIFMIVFGEDLMKSAEHATGPDGALGASIHASIGVAVLVLSVIRLGWRFGHPPPPAPATMKPWERTVMGVTHVLFYVLMIGLPLSGWLAFAAFLPEAPAAADARLFGLFTIPAAPLVGDFVKGIHGLGSNLLMVLVILHVLAALKHQFIDRDGVLRRMLPG